MSAERIKFYKYLVLDIELSAPATLVLNTGLVTITKALSAGTRRPVKLRFDGTARGRYAQVQIVPSGLMRLFGMTLYGRRVGESAEASWVWIPGPVDGTPEEWTVHPLPIPPTPEEWTAHPLPIPESSEEWTAHPLPIPESSEEWTRRAVPIPESTDLPLWANIPMDR